MIIKKRSRKDLRKAIFGVFFVIMGLFAGVMAPAMSIDAAYAVEEQNQTTEVTETNVDSNEGEKVQNNESSEKSSSGNGCQDSLGAIGWLVCPTTGKIAEAVDWLYEKLQGILTINPVSAEDGSPIYEIWKYCLGVTNILFVIFLLVVIYSQITGYGITNYGIKKTLPKLIVTAVLVNLSFLICSLAVDVSNILGSGIRGLFTAVQESVMSGSGINAGTDLSYAGMFGALAGGGALTVGAAVIAFETGAIWMLIPTVLGAIVAVASGLITIALRQAVVMLLIMISPLAIVAYILPNTEQWFKKWKQLLTKMLVFYPMFSLLFGASSLAGFAIIASATDGFGLILGTAVQIFPLFFSWSLMKMSGTFLGTINAKMQGLAAKPLAANRGWADSHRQLSKQKHLASGRAYTPSLRLMQFVDARAKRRDVETNELEELVKSKALAGHALSHYDKNGNISKKGQKAYERQARAMRYKQVVEMDKDNFNRGLAGFDGNYKNTIANMKSDFNNSKGVYSSKIKGKTLEDRLKYLDDANVTASDDLKFELARGAKIEYENAKGFQDRVTNAINASLDQAAIDAGNEKYQLHGVLGDSSNIARYNSMKNIMEGKDVDVHFAAADAAYSFNSQSQIVRSRFQTYMDLTAPTQDVVNRLSVLTENKDSNKYIDPIIAGLRTLNMRGDTDLVKDQLRNVFDNGKVELGTYASQSLANFLMFDVKGNDPFLRRFGKYINLETASMYNEKDPTERRTRKDISMYEYVNGEYIDHDEDGKIIYEDGRPKVRKSKRGAAVLLKGTSFKDMERTAIADMIQAIRENSVDIDENGNTKFNYDKFKKNEAEIWDAIMPNIISDQYSYLSGSEQITALGKGVTGVDSQKHNFDWKGIFGKEAENLTPEQRKDYIDFVNKRTKTFLGGQVPIQIAKTKTDMLESIRNQYALREAIENDPEFLEKISDSDYKMSNDEYKELENSHIDDIRKEFVGSFKEDALKGFVKMYQKGYQGEAKDGLIQLLNPNELYDKYFPTNESRRRQRDENEDDGMPIGGGEVDQVGGGPIYNGARVATEEIYRQYKGVDGQADVRSFWNQVREAISMSTDAQTGSLTLPIQEIEESLGQFTTVDELYDHIMNTIFGGH